MKKSCSRTSPAEAGDFFVPKLPEKCRLPDIEDGSFLVHNFPIKSRERSAFMGELRYYPRRCRKGINRLMYMLATDSETAYAMIKMTAMLMDLDLDDEKVVDTILMDCCGDLGVLA